jgi:hypothetical protein
VKRRVVLALVVLVAAATAVAAIVFTRGSGPSAGPLACRNCGWNGLAFPVDPNVPFTYGLLTIRNESDEDAVLDRVVPLDTTSGLRVVGEVALRTRDNPWNITASDHHRFPPPNVTDVVRPLRGYRIPPAAAKSDLHEVMLGLAVPGPGEFAFHHLAVEYHVGKKRYRAIYPFGLRVCAPARLHRTDCEPPRY